MKILKSVFLPFLVFGHVLGAQQAENVVNVDFTTFAFGDISDELYFESAGGERAPLAFHYQSRSGPYSYRGPARMEFFTMETNEEGESVRSPTLAIANIPGNASKVLLIFVPVPYDNFKYRALVFDDALDSFPRGTITVVNFFGSDVGVQFGDEKYVVKNRGTERVSIRDWLNRKVETTELDYDEASGEFEEKPVERIVSAVPVKLFGLIDGNSRKLYSRVMRVSGDKRYIIFVFHNQGTKNPGVVVRTLTEFVEAPESQR